MPLIGLKKRLFATISLSTLVAVAMTGCGVSERVKAKSEYRNGAYALSSKYDIRVSQGKYEALANGLELELEIDGKTTEVFLAEDPSGDGDVLTTTNGEVIEPPQD